MEETKESPLVFQAQLYGIISYAPYPIFWYGKEIKNWICKRDEKIDEYEKEM